MTYTYINHINRSHRVKQESQNRCIIACCLFKEIDHKKISSTKIAKMGDCNDSSSHRDSSLSSDSDGEYQVDSGETRERLKSFGIATEKLQIGRNNVHGICRPRKS